MSVGLRRRIFLAGAGLGIGWPALVRAHHGFGGRYDTSRAILLAGRVERLRIGMPHPWIVLRVDDDAASGIGAPREFEGRIVRRDEDRGQLREVEFPPVARFLELGPELRVGDRVVVIALRNCQAPHQLRGQWIRLASGREVLREGRMQTEVAGCPKE